MCKGSKSVEDAVLFCRQFRDKFQKLHCRNIYLYGVGKKTKQLLDNITDFRFAGLLDAELEGETIYGKKVFSLSDVVETSGVIIIVARPHVTNIIYERIGNFCEDNDIEIYDLHGNRLPCEDCLETQNGYWETDLELIKKRALQYDVITMDIFDTLVARSVLTIADMYQIIERNREDVPTEFAVFRRRAERECTGNYNIYCIYDKMQELTGWDRELLKTCMEYEFAMERKILSPRKEMCDLLEWLRNNGKQVCLASDMYWSQDRIRELLDTLDIRGYQALFVSCDEGKSKKDGSLFEKIKSLYAGCKILHIGDNRYDDMESAEKKGLDAALVLSEYEMLMLSDLRNLLNEADCLTDRIVLGQIKEKLFNNPFAINKYQGGAYITETETFLYCFFCPILLKRSPMEENSLVVRTSQKFCEDLGRILDLDSVHGISPKFAKAIIQWVQEHKERMTLEQRNIYQTVCSCQDICG